MMFLDQLTADPDALRALAHEDYVREAGSEAIELVMWLIMRGALGQRAKELRRFYHVPASNTAVGHIVLTPDRLVPVCGGSAGASRHDHGEC
jgi:protocatechuate 4,5-dioxygenase beta chain